MPQHVVQPFAGRIRADVDAHDARQARQHGLEQFAVAGEIAAHQPGRLTAAAKARELDAPAPQRGQRVFAADRPSAHARAHFVRIAVRHHHDVTGGQRRRFVAHANVRRALGDVMELDDPRGLGADVRQEGARLRRLQAPRSRATRVVEQARRRVSRRAAVRKVHPWANSAADRSSPRAALANRSITRPGGKSPRRWPLQDAHLTNAWRNIMQKQAPAADQRGDLERPAGPRHHRLRRHLARGAGGHWRSPRAVPRPRHERRTDRRRAGRKERHARALRARMAQCPCRVGLRELPGRQRPLPVVTRTGDVVRPGGKSGVHRRRLSDRAGRWPHRGPPHGRLQIRRRHRLARTSPRHVSGLRTVLQGGISQSPGPGVDPRSRRRRSQTQGRHPRRRRGLRCGLLDADHGQGVSELALHRIRLSTTSRLPPRSGMRAKPASPT